MIKMSIKEQSILRTLLTNVKTKPDIVGHSCINDIIKIKDDPDDIEVEPNLTCIEIVYIEGATPFTYIKADSAYQEPDTVRDDDSNIKIKIEPNLEHIENTKLDEEREDFKLNIAEIDIVDEILPNILQKDSNQDVEDGIPLVCIKADSASSTIPIEKFMVCYICNCKIYEDVSKNYKKTNVCGDCENIIIIDELKEEVSDVEEEKDTSNAEEYFFCDICEFKTDRSFKLRQHMRIHTGEKPYACNLCEYKASFKTALRKHMKTHSEKEKPFACNLCKYKSFQESHLKNHIGTHWIDDFFSCELCGYRCVLQHRLKEHMKIHTGEKPFACNLCPYKAIRKVNLTLHMQTHSVEKPYACHLCEYRTTQKGTLQSHIRIHTGEKPFACNLCEFKAKLKTTLENHLKTHTGEKPYACNLCKFKTSKNGCLTSHMKFHTKEQLFSCTSCEFKTATNDTYESSC